MKTFLFLFVLLSSLNAWSKLTYDLGYSFGKSGDNNYSEINLGVNYFFNDAIAWRNSGFHRNFSSDAIEDRYGLDTSLQLDFKMESQDQGMALRLFGGPGWRFVSEGKSAPFADAGVGATLGALRVRGGVKVIFQEVIDANLENEVQYTFGVSASGSVN